MGFGFVGLGVKPPPHPHQITMPTAQQLSEKLDSVRTALGANRRASSTPTTGRAAAGDYEALEEQPTPLSQPQPAAVGGEDAGKPAAKGKDRGWAGSDSRSKSMPPLSTSSAATPPQSTLHQLLTSPASDPDSPPSALAKGPRGAEPWAGAAAEAGAGAGAWAGAGAGTGAGGGTERGSVPQSYGLGQWTTQSVDFGGGGVLSSDRSTTSSELAVSSGAWVWARVWVWLRGCGWMRGCGCGVWARSWVWVRGRARWVHGSWCLPSSVSPSLPLLLIP